MSGERCVMRLRRDRKGPMLIVIIVIHLLIVLAMIGTVLLQRSEGGGLGIGSSGGFLTSRGTANVLTRTTAFLAAAFFATSLILSILASWERKPRSILQNTGTPAGQTQPGAPAPLGQGGGVLDTLRGGAPGGGQEAPPAPSGPQVPRSQ
jgi:preprotein translocase subunit SecG